MGSVIIASRYIPGELGSLGRASNMYIRQFQFPLGYTEKDRYSQIDSDRAIEQDYTRTKEIFERHRVGGELSIPNWVRSAWDKNVIAFLADLLPPLTGVQPVVEWTGYRVMGTVHRHSGNLVCHFELFSKHPDSNTRVYSGENAPNVEPPPRGYNSYGF